MSGRNKDSIASVPILPYRNNSDGSVRPPVDPSVRLSVLGDDLRASYDSGDDALGEIVEENILKTLAQQATGVAPETVRHPVEPVDRAWEADQAADHDYWQRRNVPQQGNPDQLA